MDGTKAIKKAILDVFFELEKKQRDGGFQRDDGIALLKPNKAPYPREKEQAQGVTTSMVDPNADTFL